MKKLKNSILFLALLILLTACGQEDEPVDPVVPESSQQPEGDIDSVPQPPDSPQSTSPEIVTEDDSLPPREGMVRSRLTNEWVEPDVANTRPIAVMIPNEVNATPPLQSVKSLRGLRGQRGGPHVQNDGHF